jgi:hypothetical protein
MKVGDFTVELVAADTKQPFTEHTAPDGQVYAEVEPDVDYFIALSSDNVSAKGAIFVDGVSLGYDAAVESSPSFEGGWERKDGKETLSALRFTKTRQEVGVTPSMLTGKVEVEFFALGEIYYDVNKNCKSTELTADSNLGGKKCIKSTTSGSQHTIDCTPDNYNGYDYKTGEYLCTITLNYCSALGLIYNKILPPPPALDESDESSPQRRRKKRKRSTPPPPASQQEVQTATTMISPEENNVDTVKTENSGVQGKVTVQLTYDLVDLTADD